MSHLHPELPPIAMIRADAEKLSRIADSSAGAFAQTADFLAREIDRAQVIEDFERRPGLVTMGARVTFQDDVTGHVRTVKLVYPGEADVSQGSISVLTPIGAALIGLSVSQSIEWDTPSGGRRSLTVLAADAVN
jgi:regulator of nucleoside diphosphate kinase